MEKLKRVVIKEEFVALTGDYRAAIILNQFIYWSERVKDFDKFIDEENSRLSHEGSEEQLEKTSGWIYKKADELIEECMLETTVKGKRKPITNSTLMQYIDLLIGNGWLDKRLNPKHKWDRTYQYRVNLLKINEDLKELGYCLQDYKGTVDTMQFQNSKFEHQKNEIATPKNENHITKNEIQNTKNCNAIPEITTEITNKDKYTKEFLEWYELYPNPWNKQQSFKNFKSLMKNETFDNLMAATKNYIEYLRKKGTDREFIVRSTNFIGQHKEYLGYLEMQINPKDIQVEQKANCGAYKEWRGRKSANG